VQERREEKRLHVTQNKPIYIRLALQLEHKLRVKSDSFILPSFSVEKNFTASSSRSLNCCCTCLIVLAFPVSLGMEFVDGRGGQLIVMKLYRG
jgi:hypothetical protein